MADEIVIKQETVPEPAVIVEEKGETEKALESAVKIAETMTDNEAMRGTITSLENTIAAVAVTLTDGFNEMKRRLEMLESMVSNMMTEIKAEEEAEEEKEKEEEEKEKEEEEEKEKEEVKEEPALPQKRTRKWL